MYVDDILLMAADDTSLEKTKDTLKPKNKMKDMGIVRWYLGMNIIDKEKWKTKTQTQYVKYVSQSFKMEDEKEVTTQLQQVLNLRNCQFLEQIINRNTAHTGR